MTLNEITFQIRGAIYDVYNELGPGLLESVYEEALVYELQKRNLIVERQKVVPIRYKDVVLKTELRLDLLVENEVIVELKSVKELLDVHFKQTLTYCRLLDKHLGILVNFNTDCIRDNIRRVAN
jgi:GxxExxY protein